MHRKHSSLVSKVTWSSIIRQALHRKTSSTQPASSALISHCNHPQALMPTRSIWRGQWWCLTWPQVSPATSKSKTVSKVCSPRPNSRCSSDPIQPLPSIHPRRTTRRKVYCSPKKWRSSDCAFLTTTNLLSWKPFAWKYGVWCWTSSMRRSWWIWWVCHRNCH